MKKNQRSTNKDHMDDYSESEDWCFICKDGGVLILCDHEGCSKAYHPRCVGKKISFLKKQKRWICSHHSCSACGVAAPGTKILSCLLCTFAVCGSCCKSSDANSEFAVVRGKEKLGLCNDCLGIVRLAEENGQYGVDGKKLGFEDPETFEYGFKECWEIIKEKEGLTLDDLYFPYSKGVTDSHDSKDTETHKSTLGKRKAEAEICEDNEDEFGSDDLAASNHKKQKLVSSSEHMTSESDLHEENNSEEKEEMIPSPTRNDESEWRFASIVASNMKLVYLRRSLVEELISKQPDSWERKLVGSYVRVENEPEDYFQIKSSYQLSQVKGIIRNHNNGEEILLHLLTREVPISMLSDCDFTEEDCEDLQERVKIDLMRRPTVVEIEQKARELHEDITKDWIERELVRLQKCIHHEKNQHGWISRELCEYLKQRNMLKQPSEQERLRKEVPQVIAEDLDSSNL
ncbi:zinc finger CCCH domain-containing protein 19-like [Rosa rugosa]|uniref:zinc finger CCCH domain-containing protein 19-like n=1 Tax=Rosa rugosa TaxID=74645 RepID=UPI002B40E2BC|nr:zinc finger CCCH domain-containing protein 19-like [Rosa rugosa]